MLLTPSERDRLLLFTAAELARARRARGLRLNAPEATALIADTVCEAARDGARLADAIAAGRSVLGPDDVLPGVADIVDEVHVEAVFDDGSRLAVISDPIGAAGDPDGPGAVLAADRELPRRDDVTTVSVTNTATVPISVTSHFHFFEVNARLRFDRAAGVRAAAQPPGRGHAAPRPRADPRDRAGADRRRPGRDRVRRAGRRAAGRTRRVRGGHAPRRGVRLSRRAGRHEPRR